MLKTAYTFDPESKLYTGSTLVQESPLEPGTWLLPNNSTLVVPPVYQENQTVAFLNGAWNIVPLDIPPPLPQNPEQDPRKLMVVSRYQAKAALYNAGLLDSVETFMASDTPTKLQKLAWTDAQYFYRLSPTVLAIGEVLGYTDTQLDFLFSVANDITA